jgi:hypothetical protein
MFSFIEVYDRRVTYSPPRAKDDIMELIFFPLLILIFLLSVPQILIKHVLVVTYNDMILYHYIIYTE